MTIQHPGEDKPGHRFEELNARRIFGEARCYTDRQISTFAIALIEPRLFYQNCKMKTDRHVDLLSESPERLPGAIVNRRIRPRRQNVVMTHAASFRETLKLVAGKLGILHR